ncbi:MAG TPA: FliH/SctL family protein [Anaeromyxobacteraceae bacterium]|jgi:flagellar biosynthesis/type III secretory pathway protein FliH|nr:FliH/SctL family protein [Anaeromyxobacteraceae bacterium]
MPGVLKGGAVGRAPAQGSTSGRLEAEACLARARAVLEEAEERAAELARAAAAAAEAQRVEATRAGREEGRAEAAALLLSAAAARDRLLEAAREELVELALAIAAKVLRRALASERDAVCELVGAALAEARGQGRVRVRLHPDDVVSAAEHRGSLAQAAGTEALELVEDASLCRGDAVVETEAGLVDARVETQLAALRRALQEVL